MRLSGFLVLLGLVDRQSRDDLARSRVEHGRVLTVRGALAAGTVQARELVGANSREATRAGSAGGEPVVGARGVLQDERLAAGVVRAAVAADAEEREALLALCMRW